MRRRALVVLFALAASVVPLAASSAPAAADAPNLTSGFGITVGGWRWVSSRTLEVDISTAKVAASAVNGPHRVRITFPNDYFTSGATRYPVLYLLHCALLPPAPPWKIGRAHV